jgi:ankyrin repeat protein
VDRFFLAKIPTLSAIELLELFKRCGSSSSSSLWVVQQLLAAGAYSSLKTSSGITPLMLAVSSNSPDILQAILDTRVDRMTEALAGIHPGWKELSDELNDDQARCEDLFGGPVSRFRVVERLSVEALLLSDSPPCWQRLTSSANNAFISAKQQVLTPTEQPPPLQDPSRAPQELSQAQITAQAELGWVIDHDSSSNRCVMRPAESAAVDSVAELLPLHRAVQCGYDDVADILLRFGVDVDQQCAAGVTPLMQVGHMTVICCWYVISM